MKKRLSHFPYNERSRPGWTPSTSLRKPLSPIRSTMKTVTYVPGTFVTLVPVPYRICVVRVAIQDGKDGEIFLEDGVHLRAIENRFRLLLVSHFLQRKWGTEDILGQAFPPPRVPALENTTAPPASLERRAHSCNAAQLLSGTTL